MQKALTSKLLDSLKPSEGKRYEVRDTLIIGLLLRVSKTGGKVWYAIPRVERKSIRIKVGTYPIVSLTDARENGPQRARHGYAQQALHSRSAVEPKGRGCGTPFQSITIP